ncbi:hypothetical protein TWF718_000870 [Orbilia javanica]|uniref:Uncharacterized protein n=1 Tax=Orbilia javanica TaxID=47235 RepID=A0AAN8MZY4_9PEZI
MFQAQGTEAKVHAICSPWYMLPGFLVKFATTDTEARSTFYNSLKMVHNLQYAPQNNANITQYDYPVILLFWKETGRCAYALRFSSAQRMDDLVDGLIQEAS